jgi:hypothetical protein
VKPYKKTPLIAAFFWGLDLNGVVVQLARAKSNDALHRRIEDFAVANFASACGFNDGIDTALNITIFDSHFHLDLG